MRVWERPVDEILAGNIATLPLAPIARVSTTELPVVIKRMEERFESEADPHEIADLWAATYIIMGLIYPRDTAKALLQGVRKMKESTTYQAILREGKAEEAKQTLLRLGQIKFGRPKATIRAKIEGIADLARLENMTDRILNAKNWEELTAGT